MLYQARQVCPTRSRRFRAMCSCLVAQTCNAHMKHTRTNNTNSKDGHTDTDTSAGNMIHQQAVWHAALTDRHVSDVRTASVSPSACVCVPGLFGTPCEPCPTNTHKSAAERELCTKCPANSVSPAQRCEWLGSAGALYACTAAMAWRGVANEVAE